MCCMCCMCCMRYFDCVRMHVRFLAPCARWNPQKIRRNMKQSPWLKVNTTRTSNCVKRQMILMDHQSQSDLRQQLQPRPKDQRGKCLACPHTSTSQSFARLPTTQCERKWDASGSACNTLCCSACHIRLCDIRRFRKLGRQSGLGTECPVSCAWPWACAMKSNDIIQRQIYGKYGNSCTHGNKSNNGNNGSA